MRIVTYNVNGINARLPILLRWLEQEQPDVICLQELKSPDEKIPKAAIEAAGYKGIWFGQPRWNGVAFLVKDMEVEEVRRGLPGDPEDKQSRYLEAIVNGIRIACIYLPNGNPAPGPKFDYKLSWFERLNRHARELLELKEPVVLTGDFNVIPTDLDAYKPERWVSDALFFPESKAAFRRLVDQGWTDAIRELYPDKKIFTFWDYYRNAFSRNAGIRIDHFLLSPELKDHLVDAGVNLEVRSWEKSSDHAPVWLELKD